MDMQRVIALVVFSASGLFLWEAWQKHNLPPAAPAPIQTTATVVGKGEIAGATIPAPSSAQTTALTMAQSPNMAEQLPGSGKRIFVRTDLFAISIDTLGGDIRSINLLKHLSHGKDLGAFPLMQDKAGAYFVTQSGLLGPGLPNHTASWSASGDSFELRDADTLDVTLTNRDTPGLLINKTYSFKRGSYVIDVRYDIKNETLNPVSPSAYFQFVRDANPPEGEHAGGNPFTGVVTFTGPAIYTAEKKYQKISFSDIDKSKLDFPKEAADGWLAMVQHYFVSAWLPQGAGKREFFTKKIKDSNLYTAGVIVSIAPAAANGATSLSMPLYAGPQEQEKLKELAPGLDLVVDYGWLKILAYPMFVVLSWIHNLVGNWGWTIIIFTILIKLVFFPLNQKAGKSMAHMKQLAPKIEAMKARYGDDKLKMNQAMMELYRTEKINPLGGCLPILVQMPFFIALYWVLLGAVELRNAPWVGWIHDLSTPDPFYVLPIIMGASMIVQTKLNPAPADPVQAKVMMIMPLVFSIMFFFFPAGLVLYWTMQNLLGIAQQWYINKSLDSVTPKLAKR
jgi:YidC/Oxa1 family membrane protein insertase